MNFQYKTNKVSKKCVYYEGTDTLKEGYPLCYNYDTTTNMNGTTIAAGAECNGKYLRVEQPSSGNADYFAGIVGPESHGFVGPGWITIVETTGSPILMGWSDDNITAGDLLYLQDASYALANSGGVGAPLARALESVNRSVTNGLITIKIGGNLDETSIYSTQITTISNEIITLSDAVAAYDGAILEANLSDQIVKEASDAKVFSDTIASDEKVFSDTIASDKKVFSDTIFSDEHYLSDQLVATSNEVHQVSDSVLSIETYLKASIASVELFLSNQISDRLYSVEKYLSDRIDSVENLASDGIAKANSDEKVLSDQIASDAKVFSDTIQSVETYLSDSIASVELFLSNQISDKFYSVEKYLSDRIDSVELFLSNQIASDKIVFSDTINSIETYLSDSIDSVETLCSNAAAAASNATVALSNKVYSEHISVGGACKRAASDMKYVLAQDPNYSDVATLASDLRTIIGLFSDMCADISNEFVG